MSTIERLYGFNLKRLNKHAHTNFIMKAICTQISRYNPQFCAVHTGCERVQLGYNHKGRQCECHKVQYETE